MNMEEYDDEYDIEFERRLSLLPDNNLSPQLVDYEDIIEFDENGRMMVVNRRQSVGRLNWE